MKDTYGTVIVDLILEEEEIMRRLHKDARWGINRAIREGLIVEESTDWLSIYDIYKDIMDGGGSEALEIGNLSKDAVVLFVCKKEDKIIAGASLTIEEGRCTLQMNASLKEYQNCQPNNLLYWECIKWAKKKGYEILDLGGWQINAEGHLEGINKFKEKWGQIAYYDKDYPFFRAIGRKLIKKSHFLFNLNKKLRGRK